MLVPFGLYILLNGCWGTTLRPEQPETQNLQTNALSMANKTQQSHPKDEDNENQSFLTKIRNEDNGTDSGLYNLGLFEGDILLRKPEEKSAVKNVKALWPDGEIVFKISDGVGCPYSRQCLIIMAAMEDYHRKTCIRFKEWTGEEDFVEIFYNSQNSGACWSEVGRSGGRQRLSLGQRCWFLGIAIHELGHVVGFWHEMNRPDRDDYIVIHWNNILKGFTSAFVKNSAVSVDTLGETFDLKSVMMYDEYAFSKDGKSPTIETKSKALIGPLWRKYQLSQSDIRRVLKLYKCDGTNPKNGFTHQFKCNFTSHSCGFRNRGKPIWKWKFVRKNEAYMFAFMNDTSSRSQLLSVNFHPAISKDNSRPQGCLSYSYFLRSSSMQLNQEVLSSVTELGHGTTVKLWRSSNTGKWYRVQMNINLGKPYRLVFEMIPNGDGSSASLDNVEISVNKCESLRNEIYSKPEISIDENDWALLEEELEKNGTFLFNITATETIVPVNASHFI
ncbi:meprin A subunit beta isoform X2 [Halyomorpha halys]|uniref:meprin A subunit beta isoform X2 n=1 Tax=Halyomorpha halys TaxID=286706 RepID=UPI000D0C9088|nr:meprin A subunit beta isoform X2 [Halyomorpha halys]